MKYMLLIYTDPERAPQPETPEFEESYRKWLAITEEMAPVTISSAPLQPVTTATTVRTDNGSPVLTDGPFAETKEILGGYYVIDVPDLDTATGYAARLPNQSWGSVEVRPLLDFPRAL